MKVTKSQKGFSGLEALLIVIILLILGSIGWFVYKQQGSKTPKDSSSSEGAAADSAAKESSGTPGCSAPVDYTMYINTEIDYCFAYPSSWGSVTLHDGVINPDYEPAGAYWGSFSGNSNASFGHVKTDWAYSGPGRGGPTNATGFTAYEMFTPHESTPHVIKINNDDKVLVATNSVLDIEGAIVQARRRFTSTPNYAGMSFQLNVPMTGSFDPYSDSPDELVTEDQFTTMETVLNSVVEL